MEIAENLKNNLLNLKHNIESDFNIKNFHFDYPLIPTETYKAISTDHINYNLNDLNYIPKNYNVNYNNQNNFTPSQINNQNNSNNYRYSNPEDFKNEKYSDKNNQRNDLDINNENKILKNFLKQIKSENRQIIENNLNDGERSKVNI